jgi:TPR repeat protein
MPNWKRISFIAMLALLFCAGLLTPNIACAQDYLGAMAVWRLQADQGNADAQNSLDDFYLNGWGVPKNPVEAMKWFSTSAGQNYSDAQFSIGQMCEEGAVIKQDFV